MLEPRSFDIYRNTTVLMIVILGYLEVDTEISDVDMKTVGFSDCRLEDNGNANSVLATM